ncbi:hypothetical protein ACROYT_G017635 [Oculina patagonica]
MSKTLLFHGIQFVRVEFFLLVFTVHLVYQVASEVYIDGSKALKRDAGDGVAYANFAAHKFRSLNLAPLDIALVKEPRECGKLCVDHSSCFSTNLAAFRDQDGRIKCELLPSDKYNNSNKFVVNSTFHHLSIKTPCSSDPCLNQATCVAKYEDNDYQCACAPGYHGKRCEIVLAANCQEIKERGLSQGDGLYWLDPDGGSHLNAFQAYCDMTSYHGGWTMCYTTDDKVKPRTEFTYSAQLPYGSDGYRTNCNNIPFKEILFVDHETGNNAYFTPQGVNQPITAAESYGKNASTYGLWYGVGAVHYAYSYQLLICDAPIYTGFFISGYTSRFKKCDHWNGDKVSPYFRTAGNRSDIIGVAFNTKGHQPLSNKLISVGLR